MSCKLCCTDRYIRETNQWLCTDCQKCTACRGEYYWVKNNIWQRFGAGNGMLCLNCLENRLGRNLTYLDFPETLPVNISISDGIESRKMLKIRKELRNVRCTSSC